MDWISYASFEGFVAISIQDILNVENMKSQM